MRIGNRTVQVVDTLVQVYPGEEMSVPIPRELLRDQQSLAAWPGEGLPEMIFGTDPARAARFEESADPDAVVAMMDRFDVSHGQMLLPARPSDELLEVAAKCSDRLFCSMRVDPHTGMDGIREIVRVHSILPNLRSLSLSPFMLWPQLPPNSKECYPIYAKAVELGLAMFINVGVPGPRTPSAVGDPMALDEVCWYFPELSVVMRHGGVPWADVCVRLMSKWPNLFYATTAFAPKHYPKEIIHFLKTRGRDQVMFGGYWPTLAYERLEREIGELGLEDGVLDSFLHKNAQRVFGVSRES